LNTFFRNRAESYGFLLTDPKADKQNIVGNEVFGRGLALFLVNGKDHFQFGNHTPEGIKPDRARPLKDISYYLSQDPRQAPMKPKWWDINDEFPPIGLPRELKTDKNIPAKARFQSGKNFTVGK
jgi:hypothetical protein